MRLPLLLSTLTVSLTVATVGLACSSDTDEPVTSTKVDEVTYLTGFGITGRESYIHLAVEKGFFAEANIKVKIEAGQAGAFNDQAVGSNKAQFATVDSTGAWVRYAKAPPAERRTRTIAAFQQRTVLALTTMDDRNIRTPRDLAGKKVAVSPGSAPLVMWPLYAKLAGIDPKGTQFVEGRPDTLNGLLVANRVDAIGVFVSGLPGVEAAEGKVAAEQKRKPRQVLPIPYSDFLTDLYGTVLITSDHMLNGNPDLVRRFTKAIFKGFKYAIENPNEAAAALRKADKTQDPVAAAAELRKMAPYTTPGAGQSYGHIEEARAARALAIMENLPIPHVPPQELIAFDFVPRS